MATKKKKTKRKYATVPIYDDTIKFAAATFLYEKRKSDMAKAPTNQGWTTFYDLYQAVSASFNYLAETGFRLAADDFYKLLLKDKRLNKAFRKGVTEKGTQGGYAYKFRYNANGKPV